MPESYNKTVINRGESFIGWSDDWVDWKDYIATICYDNNDIYNVYDNHSIKLICEINTDAPETPYRPNYTGTLLTIGDGGEYANLNEAVAVINADIKQKKADTQYVLFLLSDINETKAVTLPAVNVVIAAERPVKISMKTTSFTAKGNLLLENVTIATAKKPVNVIAKEHFVCYSSHIGSLTLSKGDAKIYDSIIDGKITTQGRMLICGAESQVTGDVKSSSKDSQLNIENNPSFYGNISAYRLYIKGSPAISGSVTADSRLYIDGAPTIRGKLTIKGEANLNGIIVRAQ